MLVVKKVAGALSESEGCKEVGLEVWLEFDLEVWKIRVNYVRIWLKRSCEGFFCQL